MAKFQGPAHISEITLASGALPVVDGVVDVIEPTQGDVANLRANGFSVIAEGAYFALPAEEPEADAGAVAAPVIAPEPTAPTFDAEPDGSQPAG